MSSNDFLKELVEAGKEYGGGGGGVIGKIKIEFGLHRYVAGHDFWTFWKPVGSKADLESAGAELIGRMQQAGSADRPNFGVKVTVEKNVLSRDEPYKADLQEFTPEWQEGAFGVVYDYIDKQDLPIGEWFFGRIEHKANPYYVKQGETGKKEVDQDGNPRFPTIRVPTEKFANEEAARAAVGSNSTSNNAGWSEKLRQNYEDIATFEANVGEIQTAWAKISKGELPWEGAPFLPKPLTPTKLKEYLGRDDMFGCEISDIDLALEMTPF